MGWHSVSGASGDDPTDWMVTLRIPRKLIDCWLKTSIAIVAGGHQMTVVGGEGSVLDRVRNTLIGYIA